MKVLLIPLLMLAACEPKTPIESPLTCESLKDSNGSYVYTRCVDRQAGTLCYQSGYGISCVDLVVRSALTGVR